jgi:predicted metal-binding membrane protein
VAALTRLGRRPTLWVELGVAAAWTGLVLDATVARGQGDSGGAGWAGGPLWICELGARGGGGHMASGARMGGAAFLAGMPMLGVMATAMMVPTALPAIRHVGGKSMFWRRRRATVEFVAVFLALWVVFAAVVLGGLGAWAPATPYALAAALALAALWQLTPLKQRAMRACHRSRPLPPHGWRASAGVADFALHNGGACIASCWAMMAAAALAGSGSLWWMAALTAAMATEKLAEKPRRTARLLAALLAAAAVGVILAAAI